MSGFDWLRHLLARAKWDWREGKNAKRKGYMKDRVMGRREKRRSRQMAARDLEDET